MSSKVVLPGSWLVILLSGFLMTSGAVESPPAVCQGTETFRYRAQMSIDGGSTWLSDSATICVTAGATVDLAARTLVTVTSGQTQAWSFSLKHSAPWAPIFGGSFLVTSVTTNGTGTATVQAGNPPDRNTTAIRTGGFIQGIVIDDDEGNTLPPATDFVTARACYRLTVPTASGNYTSTLKFTHDLGSPPTRSVVTQLGRSNLPCAKNFILTILVGGCSPQSFPACSLVGPGTVVSEGGVADTSDPDEPPQGPAAGPTAVVNDHIDFTRRIPPDRNLSGETTYPRATPDGRFLVFSSSQDFGFNTGGAVEVYRVEVDNVNGATIELISQDNNGTFSSSANLHPAISDDGMVVAFDTVANLDQARDKNGVADVYVRDFRGGTPVTRLISAASATADAGDGRSVFPSVSGDGTVVVFTSAATNLVVSPPVDGFDNVYRVSSSNAPAVPMELVSVDDTGDIDPCRLGPCRTFNTSFDGGKVVNTNGTLIVFEGFPQNPDGEFTVLQNVSCRASPFPSLQVFLRDLRVPQSKRTFVVSAKGAPPTCGNFGSIRPSINTAGTHVVFQSDANNLVVGDNNASSDVFRVPISEVIANSITPLRASVASNGQEVPGAESSQPMITSDGSHVAFASTGNLDEQLDDNGLNDT